MRKIIFDTNAYIRYLNGDTKVLNVLAEAETVFMSIFVLGELYAGFRGSTKEKQNREVLNSFLEKPTVSILEATAETAEVFGEIKDSLKRAGTPLPINDVWIAAHGIESGSVIISFDAHFKKFPGLRLWDEL
ncbi:MAG: type II toxin-antitoxin system VapC family toxin [Candidatus Aminicenantes bacterium]|nr:type II toxin-antitoxin system VapC family toxin [Candidatus Aminicenantes bacterium]